MQGSPKLDVPVVFRAFAAAGQGAAVCRPLTGEAPDIYPTEIVRIRDGDMDFLRVALILLHLLAFAVALYLVMREDLRLLTADRLAPTELEETAHGVGLALSGLFVTGLAVIWVDTGFDAAEILARPKLTAKLLVVAVLTLNGLALHFLLFPRLRQLPAARPTLLARIATAMGAISTVSWLYAAFLGVAGSLTGRLGLGGFLTLYAGLLTVGVFCALALVAPRTEALFRGTAAGPAPLWPLRRFRDAMPTAARSGR